MSLTEKPEETPERQEFYAHARSAFCVVATTEMRAFGCFILRKGVIF